MFSKCSRNKRWNELGDCSFIPMRTCCSREVRLQEQGCSRDALKTQGLENESSKVEPGVFTITCRQRWCLFLQGGYRNPMGRTALWRCLLLFVDSWKTSAKWLKLKAADPGLCLRSSSLDSVLSLTTSPHQGYQGWKRNWRSWFNTTTKQRGTGHYLNWEVPEHLPSRTVSLHLPQQAALCNRRRSSQLCWRCPQPMSFNSRWEIRTC